MNKNNQLLPYHKKLSNRIYWRDGKPYWNEDYSPRARKNSIAGCLDRCGYRRIIIKINGKGKAISSSRLRWFMESGELPRDMVDHIDHDRDNNKIENLRESCYSTNNRNTTSHNGSTSKYLGVHWRRDNKKWVAQIKDNGERVYLGQFSDEEEAGLAYNKEAVLRHGEFANLNEIEQ